MKKKRTSTMRMKKVKMRRKKQMTSTVKRILLNKVNNLVS